MREKELLIEIKERGKLFCTIYCNQANGQTLLRKLGFKFKNDIFSGTGELTECEITIGKHSFVAEIQFLPSL